MELDAVSFLFVYRSKCIGIACIEQNKANLFITSGLYYLAKKQMAEKKVAVMISAKVCPISAILVSFEPPSSTEHDRFRDGSKK